MVPEQEPALAAALTIGALTALALATAAGPEAPVPQRLLRRRSLTLLRW